ncbi:hypothetical protein [Rhodovulum strictum]|uniref:Uncharacterized protein n=1 Tax=Rhodovulum strictum TaxID=58314 RepID=A0A844B6K7_9RHOB|nr:hypothetical protein [Rhodovulum strictum]MRH22016.1 hypothetical protein [Rhodovulum strictum]
MFLELIASVAAGFGAGGIVFLLRRLSGSRLPSWSVPVAAGLAMLAYAVWSEYSWAARTMSGLPEGLVEVSRVEQSVPWKPWTYLSPQTTRLMAADIARAARREDAPEIRLVTLYFFSRWQPARSAPVLVDCGRLARADASEAALTDPGSADWRTLAGDDPLLRAVCSGRN